MTIEIDIFCQLSKIWPLGPKIGPEFGPFGPKFTNVLFLMLKTSHWQKTEPVVIEKRTHSQISKILPQRTKIWPEFGPFGPNWKILYFCSYRLQIRNKQSQWYLNKRLGVRFPKFCLFGPKFGQNLAHLAQYSQIYRF